MDISKIAKEITLEQFNMLKRELADARSNAIRDKVKSQIPPVSDIYAHLSEKQFFQQTIEIDTMLSVTFRTLTDACKQEVSRYVDDATKGEGDERLFNRKRLSYCIMEINGKSLSGTENLNESYWQLTMSGIDVNDGLKKLSEKRMKMIDVIDSTIMDKILSFYSTWEFIIYDMVNNMDIVEIAKN